MEGLAKREGPDPAFIVLGGQKCGTTLLYECLNQHPLVNRGRRRETHFFDWAWPAAAVAAAAAAGQEESQTLDQLRQACEYDTHKCLFCFSLFSLSIHAVLCYSMYCRYKRFVESGSALLYCTCRHEHPSEMERHSWGQGPAETK